MTINSALGSIRFLLVVLLISSGFAAFAAPSIGIKPAPAWVIPVVPAGKPASAKDFSEGYYTSFSEMQVHLEKKATYQRFIRQIVTESGIQNGSEISITFDPLYEHIDFHDISIWRNGQRLPQMNMSDFKVLPLETDRQRFIYNGYYSASMILKDTRKGDRVEVAYTRTGWNPVFQNKYSNVLSFYTYDYISHVHYAIIAPKSQALTFKDFNKPPAKTVRSDQGNNVYEWDLKNVKNVHYDDFVPGWYDKHPFVQVSEFKSWKEVVDWGLAFYQTPVISGALKAKVDEWKKSSDSQFDFIQKAIRFVQDEIRYLGIETGENSHRPHNPDDVFRQRYGDCKDKAFLLCAIMKANDIECDPMLVDTYKRSHLTDYLPSPANFNHVVVRIKTLDRGPRPEEPGDFMFIDATIALQGGTPTHISFPAYGQGLILKEGQTKPINIPDHSASYLTVVEDIYPSALGDTASKGLLQVKTVYFGGLADDTRSYFQDAVISETEESYLNYYRDLYDHSEFEISDTLEYYDQRDANNFSMVERYAMKKSWRHDSTTRINYLSVTGKQLYDQLIILPNRPRKDPVSLKFPYHNIYTIRVHMPGSWDVTKDSWEIVRDSYKVSFKSSFVPVENVWELTYDYETLRDFVPVDQVAQFRKDMEKLTGNLEYQLTPPDGIAMSADNVNWLMLLFSLGVVTGGILFFQKLYAYSPLAGQAHEPALELRSWVGLLGISIVVQPFSMLFAMLSNSGSVYYTISGWNALSGQPGMKVFAYHAILIFENFFNLGLISFSVLLMFLYFRKRDSFPALYSLFLAIDLGFLLADTLFAYLIFGDTSSGDNYESLKVITRQIFACAIWIPYLYKSERVKRTFVNTYGDVPVAELTESSEIIENPDAENEV